MRIIVTTFRLKNEQVKKQHTAEDKKNYSKIILYCCKTTLKLLCSQVYNAQIQKLKYI